MVPLSSQTEPANPSDSERISRLRQYAIPGRLSDMAMRDKANEVQSDPKPQARKNLKVSLLEHIKDFSGPRTMQMVIGRSPE